MLTSLYLAVLFFLKTNALFTCSTYQIFLVLVNDVTVLFQIDLAVPDLSYLILQVRITQEMLNLILSSLKLVFSCEGWQVSIREDLIKRRQRARQSVTKPSYFLYAFAANILLEAFLNAHCQFKLQHSCDFANIIPCVWAVFLYSVYHTFSSALQLSCEMPLRPKWCSDTPACFYSASGWSILVLWLFQTVLWRINPANLLSSEKFSFSEVQAYVQLLNTLALLSALHVTKAAVLLIIIPPITFSHVSGRSGHLNPLVGPSSIQLCLAPSGNLPGHLSTLCCLSGKCQGGSSPSQEPRGVIGGFLSLLEEQCVPSFLLCERLQQASTMMTLSLTSSLTQTSPISVILSSSLQESSRHLS